MYVSHQQSPSYGLNLVVQTGVPPQSLQRSVGSAIQSVSRGQALGDVRTLEQIVDQSLLGNRVVSTILAVFASIALLLSALGIYGVVSYTAAQRTQEMGVRAALGASAGHVRNVILWSGMRLTVAGLVIGFFGTLMTTRVLSTLLYGVGIDDTPTIAVVATVLGGVAGLACFIPAWRISKVGPMDALRWRV
jgi:ABC-type antimicrobial peptide transport system permease subunit